MMKNSYKSRCLRVIKRLQRGSFDSAALLVTSAASRVKSRDTNYPYRPDSDLFYLTGAFDQDLALLLCSGLRYPILFSLKPNPQKIQWEGPGPKSKEIARRIGAELVICENMRREILARLKGVECLYHSNSEGSVGHAVAREIASLPSHARSAMPRHLGDLDVVLEPERLIKDPGEVKAIISAAEITNRAFEESLRAMDSSWRESDLAASIDYRMRLLGAEPGFNTIVASGVNAATLHHTPGSKKIQKGELVLIDCGAQREMYCADISRTLSPSGLLSSWQRDLLAIVCSAQDAAIEALAPGKPMAAAHRAAAEVLTEGLVALGVLKGKVSVLMDKGAFRPFFPHGIGHTLGIDVHDVGNLRADSSLKLQEGMVVTIEPGLYIPKRIGSVPACGVRIEDDVLITKKGGKILSRGFPRTSQELDSWFGRETL